jgi:hypothetical protein
LRRDPAFYSDEGVVAMTKVKKFLVKSLLQKQSSGLRYFFAVAAREALPTAVVYTLK